MTTTKSTSDVAARNARSRASAAQKTASPPTERPVKAVPRPAPKSFSPRLVKDAEASASAPAVILWDDPVD
jgi:hypothetical protein